MQQMHSYESTFSIEPVSKITVIHMIYDSLNTCRGLKYFQEERIPVKYPERPNKANNAHWLPLSLSDTDFPELREGKQAVKNPG